MAKPNPIIPQITLFTPKQPWEVRTDGSSIDVMHVESGEFATTRQVLNMGMAIALAEWLNHHADQVGSSARFADWPQDDIGFVRRAIRQFLYYTWAGLYGPWPAPTTPIWPSGEFMLADEEAAELYRQRKGWTTPEPGKPDDPR